VERLARDKHPSLLWTRNSELGLSDAQHFFHAVMLSVVILNVSMLHAMTPLIRSPLVKCRVGEMAKRQNYAGRKVYNIGPLMASRKVDMD
jgi:hypothetical protein